MVADIQIKTIMEKKPLRRWHLFFSTFIFWVIAVALHAVWNVTDALSHPTGDLYANHIGFQLIVFAIFRLPIWIIVFLAALAVRTKMQMSDE